ncbi:MAG: hypothetical protein K2I83_01535 [Bacteroidales bacterium]|nr:hypothetical protein [Bacteroidales bacterium]
MKARTFDELLDAEYGVAGTPERERFDADSAAQQAQIAIDEFYALIEQAQETARKIGLTQKDIDREIKNMRAEKRK